MEDLVDALLVAVVETEREAVAWLASQRTKWDIAVVDMFLKEGTRLGVIRACIPRTAQQRAVVLTNYATAEMRARCVLEGADAVFDKSTELDAFLTFCGSVKDSA